MSNKINEIMPQVNTGKKPDWLKPDDCVVARFSDGSLQISAASSLHFSYKDDFGGLDLVRWQKVAV